MGKFHRVWICVQRSGAVLLGILGGKEFPYPRQKKTAASVYYSCLALLRHKAMPVCPMSHMGHIGRH